MNKMGCIAALILPTLLVSSRLLAHEGSHDTIRLPPYELNQQKSYASLRITEVNGAYIVAFASSQYNFLKNEEHELKDDKLQKQRAGILEKLKDPNSLFNAKDFQCNSAMTPHISNEQKLRQKDPAMSFKYVKETEVKKYTESIAMIAAQYKLVCKKALDRQAITIQAFDIAPQLDNLLVRLSAGKEGSVELLLKRPKTRLADAEIAKAQTQTQGKSQTNKASTSSAKADKAPIKQKAQKPSSKPESIQPVSDKSSQK